MTRLWKQPYLDGFYNQGGVLNITTVPLLWVWTTAVLAVLAARQIFEQWGKSASKSLVEGDQNQSLFRRVSHLSFLLISIALFVACLAYQYGMVAKYRDMDVIDVNGWSFGQKTRVARRIWREFAWF